MGLHGFFKPKSMRLINDLLHEDDKVRHNARESLLNMGDGAVTSLVRTMKVRDDVMAEKAASILIQIGEPAVASLISLLDSPPHSWVWPLAAVVRGRAIRTLGHIADKRAIQPLIAALKGEYRIGVWETENRMIRWKAAHALSRIQDVLAVEALINCLDDKDSGVRSSCADALGNIGDKRSVQPLIRSLHDIEPIVRRSAVEALGKIGDKEAAKEILIAMAGDLFIREVAEKALEMMEKRGVLK